MKITLKQIIDSLEKEIILQDFYHKCPDFHKDCVQCKFWKQFDNLMKGLIKLENECPKRGKR